MQEQDLRDATAALQEMQALPAKCLQARVRCSDGACSLQDRLDSWQSSLAALCLAVEDCSKLELGPESPSLSVCHSVTCDLRKELCMARTAINVWRAAGAAPSCLYCAWLWGLDACLLGCMCLHMSSRCWPSRGWGLGHSHICCYGSGAAMMACHLEYPSCAGQAGSPPRRSQAGSCAAGGEVEELSEVAPLPLNPLQLQACFDAAPSLCRAELALSLEQGIQLGMVSPACLQPRLGCCGRSGRVCWDHLGGGVLHAVQCTVGWSCCPHSVSPACLLCSIGPCSMVCPARLSITAATGRLTCGPWQAASAAG